MDLSAANKNDKISPRNLKSEMQLNSSKQRLSEHPKSELKSELKSEQKFSSQKSKVVVL